MLSHLTLITSFVLVFFATSLIGTAGATEETTTSSVTQQAQTQDFSFEAKQAVLSEDLDLASELIETVLEEHPDHAESHRVAGDIYITRAQGASLFSAPGLAKKALKSYQKAVELDPKNIHYRTNLLQFYLQAPSIVGGDKDKAVEQAAKIKQLNPVKGVIAQAQVNRANEDLDTLEKLFASLTEELAEQPQVRLEQAQHWLSSGKISQGISQLELLAALDPSIFSDLDDKKVPIKAFLTLGFWGLKDEGIDYTEKSIISLEKYIETAPNEYGYPSKNWIRLSLGKLYAQIDDVESARKTFEEIQSQTKSKSLLKETKKALKKL